jgi:CRP-like cAMP-binding protein
MRHSNISVAPATTDTSVVQRFTDLFHQRLDALNLIKQLNHMIKAVQRHRGMSMGLLGGNALFREEFTKLQHQIAERLQFFSAFVARTQLLLPQRDQENLHSAWLTISHDWQEDSVIDNYELHCHLIEQLLAFLASLAKQLEQPIAAILTTNTEPTQIYALNN